MATALRIRMGGPAGYGHAVAAAATGAGLAAAGGVSPRPAVAAVTGEAFRGSITVAIDNVYGPGVSGIGLSNTTLGGPNYPIVRSIMGFRAPVTGYIASFRFYYLGPGAGVGYAGGTGGTHDFSLYAVDVDGNPTGAAIATQSSAAVGSSNAGRLITCGTSWAVTAGQRYALDFLLTDASPTVNYFAPDYWNGLYSPDLDPAVPFDANHIMGPRWHKDDWYHKYLESGVWKLRRGYLPILDITYGSGTHQGMAYIATESRNDPARHGKISGANEMIRSRWTQGTSRTATHAYLCTSKESGVTQDLVLTLRNSSDTVLGTVTVPAASVPTSVAPATDDGGTIQREADKYWGSERQWVGGALDANVSLLAGQEYRLRAASAGGPYWVNKMYDGSSHGYSRSVTWADDGVAERTTDGVTWATFGVQYPTTSDYQFSLVVV